MDRGAWWAAVRGVARVRHDWATKPPPHNSKASIFWCSAFFMVQLLYPYMATGKTIALTFMCMNSFDTLCGI